MFEDGYNLFFIVNCFDDEVKGGVDGVDIFVYDFFDNGGFVCIVKIIIIF